MGQGPPILDWMHSINQRQQPVFVPPWETPGIHGQSWTLAQQEERRRREEQGLRELAGIVVGAVAVIGVAIFLGRAFR